MQTSEQSSLNDRVARLEDAHKLLNERVGRLENKRSGGRESDDDGDPRSSKRVKTDGHGANDEGDVERSATASASARRDSSVTIGRTDESSVGPRGGSVESMPMLRIVDPERVVEVAPAPASYAEPRTDADFKALVKTYFANKRTDTRSIADRYVEHHRAILRDGHPQSGEPVPEEAWTAFRSQVDRAMDQLGWAENKQAERALASLRGDARPTEIASKLEGLNLAGRAASADFSDTGGKRSVVRMSDAQSELANRLNELQQREANTIFGAAYKPAQTGHGIASLNTRLRDAGAALLKQPAHDRNREQERNAHIRA